MQALSLDQALAREHQAQAPDHSPDPASTPLTRIIQVLEGASWGELTPTTIEKGLGGRETALLQLSRQWASPPHNLHIMNFVPISAPYKETFPDGGSIEMIDQKLAPHYLNSTHQDVVIAWEHDKLFSYKNIAKNIKVKIIGMQVAHFEVEDEQVQDIDAIVVLSDWARRFLISSSPNLKPIPFFSIPNGVDLGRFSHPSDPNRRTNGKFFYSSSPDRGLVHLLRAWPKVRTEIPNATLYVAYGATRWTSQLKWAHYLQGGMALEIEHRLRQPGIIDVGLIGQSALAKIQMECSMLPYTCDTMSPTETGCITVTEALAARCPVVTTDCDCLEEEYSSVAQIVPLPYDEDRFLNTMFTILEDEDRYAQMQVAGRKFAEARSWHNTSQQWMKTITTLMANTMSRG
jgi:glycosyltransferase involved in cell wall biosynthesis